MAFGTVQSGLQLSFHVDSYAAIRIAAGLLPGRLRQAQVLLIRVLVASRLLAPETDEPHGAACIALARACGAKDYPALLESLAEARQVVAAAWKDVFGDEILEQTA